MTNAAAAAWTLFPEGQKHNEDFFVFVFFYYEGGYIGGNVQAPSREVSSTEGRRRQLKIHQVAVVNSRLL